MLPDYIRVSDNPGADLRSFLSEKNYSKTAVLVDNNTELYCYPFINKSLDAHDLIRVDSGERQKSVSTCEMIWRRMTEIGMDRHAVLIILGGGVPGDMGGFCASTFKRGIDFILIPTTLLAQADASIGGKLGIDFGNFKNHIGVFQNPVLNLLHDGFLKTLPESELRSGFAEVIKHALISDKGIWSEIKSRPLQQQDWKKLLRHSAEFKSAVVTEDSEERGLRKILNAGHTIGHAIEGYFLSSGRAITHGEAVIAGLVTEFWIGEKRGLLDSESYKEVESYLTRTYGKLELPEKDLKEIASRCLQDKKNKGNKILCVLPNGIGKAQWNVEISLEEIVESLAFYISVQM